MLSTTRLIVAAVLLLGAVLVPLVGRAAPPATQPAAATQPAYWQEPVLKGEPGGPLAAEADSLDALVAKAKPDFRFGEHGRDFLWIENGQADRPAFVISRAFAWQSGPGRVRWVLLRRGESYPGWRDQIMGAFWPARVEVTDEISGHDSGPDPYAIVKSSNRIGDHVYQVGWSSAWHRPENGELFLLREAGGHWVFLGEGPSWSGEVHHEVSYWTSVESKVVWTGDPDTLVRIEFTDTYQESDMKELPNSRGELSKITEAVLEAPWPGKLRWTTDRPYMLARPGETMDKVATLLAVWTLDNIEVSPEIRDWVETAWRREVVRLNPKLAQGLIAAGTRVQLLDGKEEYALIEAPLFRRRQAAAGKASGTTTRPAEDEARPTSRPGR